MYVLYYIHDASHVYVCSLLQLLRSTRLVASTCSHTYNNNTYIIYKNEKNVLVLLQSSVCVIMTFWRV